MTEFTVNLKDRSYPIYFGDNIITDGDLLRRHVTARQVMIVTNNIVAPYYLSTIKNAFAHYQCDEVILPDGESHKNLSEWKLIVDALAENGHHRDTTLIALGGGVVGDITGFAAACYQRGVNYFHIPTTLLAQVDASIGGKTAVNHPLGKNLIGAFHQPAAVLIDVHTLKTLPEREFKAGIAEIVKAALIRNPALFQRIEQHLDQILDRDPSALLQAIQRACEIKCSIVVADEKETRGERALLNLGHTFGHAIEHTLGYGKWLHGEAVSVGLVLAAQLSASLGWLSSTDVNRIQQLLSRIPLPTRLPNDIDLNALNKAMQMDKKVSEDRLRFVLLKSIGHAVLTDAVSDEMVQSLWKT